MAGQAAPPDRRAGHRGPYGCGALRRGVERFAGLRPGAGHVRPRGFRCARRLGRRLASYRGAATHRGPRPARGERRARVPCGPRLLAEPVVRLGSRSRDAAHRPDRPGPRRHPPGRAAGHPCRRGPLLLRALRPEGAGESADGTPGAGPSAAPARPSRGQDAPVVARSGGNSAAGTGSSGKTAPRTRGLTATDSPAVLPSSSAPVQRTALPGTDPVVTPAPPAPPPTPAARPPHRKFLWYDVYRCSRSRARPGARAPAASRPGPPRRHRPAALPGAVRSRRRPALPSGPPRRGPP